MLPGSPMELALHGRTTVSHIGRTVTARVRVHSVPPFHEFCGLREHTICSYIQGSPVPKLFLFNSLWEYLLIVTVYLLIVTV